MNMKMSDYIADFLAKQGIRHVFAITGGACIHLIDSLSKHPDITFICPQHEQAGAMAADAYSRITGNLGVALATSGPGATNMMTGVCCAYFDSVPVLYITGQVASFRSKGNTGVRQVGFQETDTVDMYRPITKYAVLVKDRKKIRYELEKAVSIAKTGRPGPVLVDIPDDFQREPINTDELEPFIPTPEIKDLNQLKAQIGQCLPLLQAAKRPVVILGWGVRLSKAEEEAKKLVEKLGFPIVPTWGIADLFPSDHPLLAGTFGVHGTRYGNYTVQNADLVLAVGTRLDTHEAGSPLSSFAREAKRIIVDIDPFELKKFGTFGLTADLLIQAEAKDFLSLTLSQLKSVKSQDLSAWKKRISGWKEKYPICPPAYYAEKKLNPYVFVKTLSKRAPEGEIFFIDTGCAVAWMMQAFEFKTGQRAFSAFNNTPMGYALPASMGASLALDKKQITCVVGDGALQMNIQELATLLRHDLPIKIFLINNHGYSMVQQTQDQWLNSRYAATTVEGGLAFPNFVRVAEAYGYKTLTIDTNKEVDQKIAEAYNTPGPLFCNVEIDGAYRVVPQAVYGRPIEDAEPLLGRKEFFENMIVKPTASSLK
ncbi:MAG: thiamine pyrophosphate-binding protein [Deltaproteobacteria bacterium]|nr:thiamine pyrophosphate-binding protein [Deltaproteobacteria bacterium]